MTVGHMGTIPVTLRWDCSHQFDEPLRNSEIEMAKRAVTTGAKKFTSDIDTTITAPTYKQGRIDVENWLWKMYSSRR